MTAAHIDIGKSSLARKRLAHIVKAAETVKSGTVAPVDITDLTDKELRTRYFGR